MKRIYLDYAATTPVDPLVVKAMLAFFSEKFGNPSSIHSFGQEAKKAIEDVREKIAAILGAVPEEIIFTSGGTESNNFALLGVAAALEKKGDHIITSAIEHHAVLGPCGFLEKKGFKITRLGVDKSGLVSPEEVKAAITDKTILISVMHANNEIGTIQPIKEIGRIAKERGVYFHSDAVQTVGHLPISVDDLNVDLLSLSAHKFYGPKGIGALYVRKGTHIEKFLHGAGQERGLRASTHNTSGIVGMGKALEISAAKLKKETILQAKLRDQMIKQIEKNIPDVFLNGHRTKRLSNNINFSFKGVEGDTLLVNLDLLGIAASSGSACSSTSLEPSHVLMACGLSREIAQSAIRFSLGRWSTAGEVDYLLGQLTRIVKKLRS
ncbi:MAG: cysteine desulfurase NifS [Candidatus Omnitrophica bacterium]|nr:cysteine desulfurase NifS [Candidatus Omnitrophota bacterium]